MSRKKDHARKLTESEDPREQRTAKALSASLMILSEDCTRESGNLLSQIDGGQEILDPMTQNDDPEFPREIVAQLKKLLG